MYVISVKLLIEMIIGSKLLKLDYSCKYGICLQMGQLGVNNFFFLTAPDFSQESKWVKRGNLVDSRSSIVDVKFAPKHLGLKLVSFNVWCL